MRDLQTRPDPKALLDKNTGSMLLRIKSFRGPCLESLETTVSCNWILASSLEALCQEACSVKHCWPPFPKRRWDASKSCAPAITASLLYHSPLAHKRPIAGGGHWTPDDACRAVLAPLTQVQISNENSFL